MKGSRSFRCRAGPPQSSAAPTCSLFTPAFPPARVYNAPPARYERRCSCPAWLPSSPTRLHITGRQQTWEGTQHGDPCAVSSNAWGEENVIPNDLTPTSGRPAHSDFCARRDDKAGDIPSDRLLSMLGEGGRGEVWLAERREAHRSTRRRKDHQAPAWIRVRSIARFEQERRAAAMMDHPNVAPCLRRGHDAGTPLLRHGYVGGGSITEYCDHRNQDDAPPTPPLQTIVRAVSTPPQGIIHPISAQQHPYRRRSTSVQLLGHRLASPEPCPARSRRDCPQRSARSFGTPGT